MTKNKIVKRCILITVLSAAVFFSAIFVHYFFTTMSVDKCIEYCIEHSERNATNFVRIGDGRYAADYAYFIAADGDSSKAQEIFVFKRTFLGFITFDRYKFVMSSTQSGREGENKFGSLQFFTRNDKGEKETEATLLFFGANRDSDITTYEYTLTVREGSNVYSGTVIKGQGASIWFVKFYGLGNIDENDKKIISDVKFYDSNGNLVGVY
ncbi:MAG: hypothetical protein K2G60_02415 [Oscillospiraceae bacterium]|nr:hypothetical protein [Oscillospiraceae bacterium]